MNDRTRSDSAKSLRAILAFAMTVLAAGALALVPTFTIGAPLAQAAAGPGYQTDLSTPRTAPTASGFEFDARSHSGRFDVDADDEGSGVSLWHEIPQRTRFRYYAELMGPSPARPSGETYNVFTGDANPLQLYHFARVSFDATPWLQIGIHEAAVENLNSGVNNRYGFAIETGWSFYDPALFFDFVSPVAVGPFDVYNLIAVQAPITQGSIDSTEIMSVDLQQTWAIRLPPSMGRWAMGFTTDFNPTFYREATYLGLYDQAKYGRPTLSANVGPYLVYNPKPWYALFANANFDIDRTGTQTKVLEFGSGLEDRGHVGARFFPLRGFLTKAELYYQYLVYHPRAETSIIGFDVTFNF